MPIESAGPLSHPVDVTRLPDPGLEVTVEANEAERAALARDFGLPAIHLLVGRYRITGTPRRIVARGTVEARLRQVCVVTLDEFDSDLREEVDVDFSEDAPSEGQDAAVDGPDPVIDGQIDLGAITAEFLAIGLDPYPRKPGAEFAAESPGTESPFAVLARLKADT